MKKEFGEEPPHEGYWDLDGDGEKMPVCIHHNIMMIMHPVALVDYCPKCYMESDASIGRGEN